MKNTIGTKSQPAPLQALETPYNGYRFRSRLEARWAVFFDALALRYQYEPEGYALTDGRHYLPDFWLEDLQVFFEVKPTAPDEDARAKCQGLARDTHKKVLLTMGAPVEEENHLLLFCEEFPVLEGHFAWCRRGEHLSFLSQQLWEDPEGGPAFFGETWDCFSHETPRCEIRRPLLSPELVAAIYAARAARFGIHDKSY